MNIFYVTYARTIQFFSKIFVKLIKWPKIEVIEGENCLRLLPKYILNRRLEVVLIITDQFLSKSGLLLPLLESLEKDSIKYYIYDKGQSNPVISNVEDAYLLYVTNKCEALIAFGGGSPLDIAKLVGAKVVNPNKSINKLGGFLKVKRFIPPLFAIPTTAGSGSEASIAAVVTDDVSHHKFAVNDPKLLPKIAVLDPTLTISLSPFLTATTGLDALTHAIECYIGRSNTKETKENCEKAIKIIFENIVEAYNDGNNIEARSNMQKAAFYAGLAFTKGYIGYVHALAHPLGGLYNIPHGSANATLLPHVLRKYGRKVYKQLAKLADIISITNNNMTIYDKANAFIQKIDELNITLQIITEYEQIKEKDLETLVNYAYNEANPFYPVPKILSKQELKEIYYEVIKK